MTIVAAIAEPSNNVRNSRLRHLGRMPATKWLFAICFYVWLHSSPLHLTFFWARELHFNHCQICESCYALGILPYLEITVCLVNLRAYILNLCEERLSVLIFIRQRHMSANHKRLRLSVVKLQYIQLDLEKTLFLISGLVVAFAVTKAIPSCWVEQR